MDKTMDSTVDLDVETLKAELDFAYQSLLKLQYEFYNPILALPTMQGQDLPLIKRSMAGARDLYSHNINYFFYPWLFIDTFPEIKTDDLNELCIIAQIYAESFVQLDKVIDNQLEDYSNIMQTLVLISSQYKLSIGIQRLSWLFDKNSPYWDRYNQLLHDHFCIILEEKTNKSLEVPSLRDMEKSASSKVALTSIVILAMGELTGKKDALPAIEASMNYFSIGYQLYDDVKDWQRDYLSGQYSYLLKIAFKEFDLAGEISAGKGPGPQDLGRRLYLSEIIPDILQLAEDYMKRAREASSTVNCPKWIGWIEVHRNNIIKLRSDLLEIRSKAVERAKLKSVPHVKDATDRSGQIDRESCLNSLKRGMAFLQDQESKDYLEARHYDFGSKTSVRSNGPPLHRGTVFQRAITLHTLAMARQNDLPVHEKIFNDDLQVLLDSRPKNRIGGWNYFPDIPDLPPDCDDLAEILLTLLSISHPNIPELCDKIIGLALQDQKQDGSIYTWIADREDSDSVKARDHMHATWGLQPDAEVMANFLYALWKYDKHRFMDNITRGTAFIAGRQDSGGFWTSTWYDGPYYGTFVCCRHLKAIGGYDNHLQTARKFLLKKREENCTWESDDEGILNTAFALITLVDSLDERDPDIVWQAAGHIIERQRADGSWKGSRFIKMMPKSRESLAQPGLMHYYESDTIATAFAVRALLSLKKLLK
jgi:hypothetical protein